MSCAVICIQFHVVGFVYSLTCALSHSVGTVAVAVAVAISIFTYFTFFQTITRWFGIFYLTKIEQTLCIYIIPLHSLPSMV